MSKRNVCYLILFIFSSINWPSIASDFKFDSKQAKQFSNEEESLVQNRLVNDESIIDYQLIKFNPKHIRLRENKLGLKIFDLKKVTFNRQRVDVGPDGELIWTGYSGEMKRNQIALTIFDDNLFGTIYIDGRTFQIMKISNKYHLLTEHQLERKYLYEYQRDDIEPTFSKDKNAQISIPSTSKVATSSTIASSVNPSHIKLLVVVTDKVWWDTSNRTTLLSRISNRLSYIPTVLSNTVGSAITFEHVATEHVSYDDSGAAGSNEVMRYFRDELVSQQSEIRTLRDFWKADLVLVVGTKSDACGRAYRDPISYKFGILYWNAGCTNLMYVMAHEFGHSLGIKHNWELNSSSGYEHGYLDHENDFKTVVSYGGPNGITSCEGPPYCDEVTIPYYSNDDSYYNGVSMGSFDREDGKRKILETAPKIASFYPESPSAPTSPQVNVSFNSASCIDNISVSLKNNATYYKIYHSAISDMTDADLIYSGSNNWLNADPAWFIPYYYTAQACNSYGCSDISNITIGNYKDFSNPSC